MRRTIAWYSLLVLDRTGHLGVDVLYQRSTAGHVEDLHSETDREYGYSSSFGGFNHEKIGLVFDRLDCAKLWMRLVTVAQRVYVGVASGKQDAVQLCDHRVDVIGVWNQAYMNGDAAGRLDGLTVIPSKIETIRCLFDAHRDTDAWSWLHHSVRSIPSAAIITYVLKLHHYNAGRRP